jgi:hypothetical protein
MGEDAQCDGAGGAAHDVADVEYPADPPIQAHLGDARPLLQHLHEELTVEARPLPRHAGSDDVAEHVDFDFYAQTTFLVCSSGVAGSARFTFVRETVGNQPERF